MERKDFKRLVHEVLDERDSIDKETHQDHHRFVAHMIDRRDRANRSREKIRNNVIGWGIVIAIITMVSALGAAAKKWMMG